jgi:hypothetical protein
MFKKVFVVLSVILICSCILFTTTFAEENTQSVEDLNSTILEPNWREISEFSNNFEISTSGLSTVESLLYAFNVDSIGIVANLQQYRNGSWVTIKSWSSTSTDVSCAIAEQWYTVSGYSYRMVTTGTVYENGSQAEQTTYTSSSYYY